MRIRIRTILLGFVAILAVAAPLTLATTSPASAVAPDVNCVQHPETHDLSLGMTPPEVRRTVGAMATLRQGFRVDGQRYVRWTFSDCNDPNGREFVAIFDVNEDDRRIRHLTEYQFLRP